MVGREALGSPCGAPEVAAAYAQWEAREVATTRCGARLLGVRNGRRSRDWRPARLGYRLLVRTAPPYPQPIYCCSTIASVCVFSLIYEIWGVVKLTSKNTHAL